MTFSAIDKRYLFYFALNIIIKNGFVLYYLLFENKSKYFQLLFIENNYKNKNNFNNLGIINSISVVIYF